MGTNQCASQSGMNPYGLSRQIYDAREAKKIEENGQTYGSQFSWIYFLCLKELHNILPSYLLGMSIINSQVYKVFYAILWSSFFMKKK